MAAELAARRSSRRAGRAARRACSPSGTPSRSRRRRSARCTGRSPTTGGRSRSRCSTRASTRRSGPTSTTSACSSAAMGMLFPGLDPSPIVDRAARPPRRGARLRASRPTTSGCSPTTTAATRSSTSPRWSTSCRPHRVLTTELADGRRASTRCVTWGQEERNLAAETIYRFVFGSLYRLRVFNGDPHPGNYLFRPGRPGDVPRLRAGEALQADEVAIFEDMIDAMVLDRDPPRSARIVEDVGLLPAGHAVHRRAGRSTTSATSTSSCSRGRRYTITARVRVRDGAPVLRPERPARRDHEGGQPPAGVRDHPAHQPRALRHVRRAAAPPATGGASPRSCGPSSRRRRRRRWARPTPPGSDPVAARASAPAGRGTG